jgi:hypothetical protein
MFNVDLSIHDFDGRAVVALRGELNLGLRKHLRLAQMSW